MNRLYYRDYCHRLNDSVAVEFRNPQEPFPEHNHDDFAEIVIVDSGNGVHVLNDYPYSVNGGMLFYIKPEDHHLFEQVDDLRLVNLLYKPINQFTYIHNFEHLLPKTQDNCLWNISPELKKELTKLISQLSLTTYEDQLIEQCHKENLFLQILLLLWQGRYRINKMDSNQDKLQQLLLFLQQHDLERLDWEQLAARFYLTPRTLHRQFILQTGQTPQKYFNNLRLNRAKYLLKISDKPLTDIAFSCGFVDSNNFSTLFKKTFGLSPSQMRKRYSC